MSKDLVRNYYASFGEREWERLTWPEGQIEFAVTTHALVKHLPRQGRVLDIGGGAGRWSIWLAQQGYEVVLADLSPNLLDIAQQKMDSAGVRSSLQEIAVADVCDLSRWDDGVFDAVLCLGPFYHLIDPSDREQAASELVRVLKPNGVAFIAFMPIYSFLRRTLALHDEQQHLADASFVSRLMSEGVFINDVEGRFNSGYGVKPQDIAPFLTRHGLQQIELLADTGFAGEQARALAEMAETNPSAYAAAMDIIIRTASDPSILGASIHLLYVGKKFFV